MNPKQVICTAIKDKKLLKLTYHSETRVVEPFIYGKSSQGNLLLSVFQVKNLTHDEKEWGWRLFEVSELEGVELLDIPFIVERRDYNPEDKSFQTILCRGEVKPSAHRSKSDQVH